MWLLDCLTGGFQVVTADATIQLFRVLVAVAIWWKTAAVIFYGEWNRLAAGSFNRWQLAKRRGQRAADLIAVAYRPIHVVRLVAATALAIGWFPKTAVVVLVAGLAFEVLYEYRFNTIYIALCTGCLIFAGNPGTGLSMSAGHSTANTFSQFLVVIITMHLYLNSAWLKSRSMHFRSGLYLAQVAWVAHRVRPSLPLWEYWHPATGVTRGSAAGGTAGVWRAMSVGTIALEAVVPLALLAPRTWPLAAIAGLTLHLAFAFILPIRLLPFSLTCVATYPLFLGG